MKKSIFENITKRERIEKALNTGEEALSASEDGYRNLIENVTDWIFVLNKEYRVLFLNKTTANFFGKPANEIIGKRIFKISPKETAARFSKHIAKVFNTGKSKCINEKMSIGDKEFYNSICLNPIKDNKGKIVAVMGIARDITAEKKVEEELKDANEKWLAFTKNSKDIIMLTDRKGTLLSINNPLPPYTSKNSVGKPLVAFVPKEQHKLMNTCLAKVFKTGQPDIYDVSSDIPKAGVFWFSTKLVPIKDKGKVKNVIMIFTDITDRKKAEEELRAKEARYRSYIDLTGQIGWVTNAAGEIEEDVPSFRKFTGQTYKEIKGSRWIKTIHPDDVAHTMKAWNSAVSTKSAYEVEYRMRRHDGVYRNLLARGFPILNDDGSIREWVGTCIDITERKKMEDALKESEERHRILYEFSADAIMTLEPPDWMFTSGNPATVKMFRAKDEKEFTSKGPWELSPEKQPDGQLSSVKAKKMIMKAMKEGSNFFEWTHKRIDAEDFPATVLLTRITLGNKTFLQATVRDVTEQKKAEEELRRNNEIKGVLNDILKISQEKHSIDETLLISLDKILSLPWLNILSKGGIFLVEDDSKTLVLKAHRNLAPQIKRICARVPFGRCICGRAAAARKILFVNKVDLRHDNGYKGIKPHGHYCVPIFGTDKRVIGMIALYVEEGHKYSSQESEYLSIISDTLSRILERKKAEEALKGSEGRFRSIFENANDGIVLADVKTKKFYLINKRFQEMLGYSAEELKRMGVMGIHPKKDLPYVLDQFEKQAKREVEIAKELPVKRKDGSIFYADVNSFPITLAGNEYLVGMFTDVTERKKAEEIVKSYSMKLETEVSNRTAELIEEKRKVEELSKVKDEFIRNITHELKTPLSVILGNLPFLKDIAPIGKEKEWLSILDVLNRNSTRLRGSIDQILSLDKASTTRTRKERVYLRDVLNDIYKDYSPLLQMKGLTCDMDIGPIALIGDNELLRIAFSNLFSNAVKFTNKGGVKLSARSYDHTVSIHIRDTGIGISLQDQRKLFERFFKASPSAPGTGVGLALVKEIIDKHEGKIKVKSKLGKGTEFEILLPHYGGKGVDK